MGQPRKDIRQLVVRLNPRRDRDLIEAVRAMPRGEPSDLAREGLRLILGLRAERPHVRLTVAEAAPVVVAPPKRPNIADLDECDW